MFSFRWLRDANQDLVPHLLLIRDTPLEAMRAVLNKILEIRRLRPSALIVECYPSLLVRLICKGGSDVMRRTFEFIDSFTQGECTRVGLISYSPRLFTNSDRNFLLFLLT